MANAGELLVASDLVSGPFDFTPQWTATTTDPTGWSSAGWYFTLGKLRYAHAVFTPGGAFNKGSGVYRFDLPDSTSASIASEHSIGDGIFRDSSGSTRYGLVQMPTGSGGGRVYAMYDDGTGKVFPLTDTAPVAPASGDSIVYNVMYWVD